MASSAAGLGSLSDCCGRGATKTVSTIWAGAFDTLIKNVLLQPRIFNERSIGLPHFLIFWGFVIYAVCFNWALVRGLFPFLPIPYPDEVRPAELFLEVFSVLVLVCARRWPWPGGCSIAPQYLHLSLDANFILGLIGLLMLTTLFGSAFRIVSEGGQASAWAPFGSLLVPGLCRHCRRNTARSLSNAMWWLHMIVVLFFLVYLPYSKHLHLLASPFNVFFSRAPRARSATWACSAPRKT